MRKLEFKRAESPVRGLLTGLAVMVAALMLLTNCGSAKSAGSASGDAYVQVSEHQLTNDCALLHLYRPATKVGVLVSYDLYLDKDVVFRAKYKTKTTIRLTSEGQKMLWAMTESKTELPVDIRLGQEYFVSCDIGIGAFVGRPRLRLMDNKLGKTQFAKIPSSKK